MCPLHPWPVGDQTITLNGTIAGDSFTGTYTINGGCASGDQGKVRCVRIPFIAKQSEWHVHEFHQPSVRRDRQLGSSQHKFLGKASDNRTSQLHRIMPGLWNDHVRNVSLRQLHHGHVGLEVVTNNGTLAFLGTLNQVNGQIAGSYTVSGEAAIRRARRFCLVRVREITAARLLVHEVCSGDLCVEL
jgi:hypothetical protein